MIGFKPVIDEKTEVLLMGTFPGEESLRKNQYYGHPRNNFWKFLGLVVGEDLAGMTYEERLDKVLMKKFGIWDVFYSCEREGSLDQNIVNAKLNDFSVLKKFGIKLVCFNGQKAGKFRKKFEELGFKTMILPSSSPANASQKYGYKAKEWGKINKHVTLIS